VADVRHVRRAELEAGLDHIRASPADKGLLELVVRRPEVGEREVVAAGELTASDGLVGDMWQRRGSRDHVKGAANVDRQVTVMNSRCIALLAQDPRRWALAGDQLYVDLDLSVANLPVGTQLAIGSALVEVTAEPHLGCGKFQQRFGWDAVLFVNSRTGRELRLRGLSARVVTPGAIRTGAAVRRLGLPP
jgi:MOSC domain-containing protein YiiM